MELQNLLSPFLLRRVKSEVRYHFTVINNIKSFLFISDMDTSVLTYFGNYEICKRFLVMS